MENGAWHRTSVSHLDIAMRFLQLGSKYLPSLVRASLAFAVCAMPATAQGGALRFDGAGDICSVQNAIGDFDLALASATT
jgi:hypothetical protein